MSSGIPSEGDKNSQGSSSRTGQEHSRPSGLLHLPRRPRSSGTPRRWTGGERRKGKCHTLPRQQRYKRRGNRGRSHGSHNQGNKGPRK